MVASPPATTQPGNYHHHTHHTKTLTPGNHHQRSAREFVDVRTYTSITFSPPVRSKDNLQHRCRTTQYDAVPLEKFISITNVSDQVRKNPAYLFLE